MKIKYFALGRTHQSEILHEISECFINSEVTMHGEGSGASGYHFWVEQKDLDQAIKVFQNILKEHPDWPIIAYDPPSPMIANKDDDDSLEE